MKGIGKMKHIRSIVLIMCGALIMSGCSFAGKDIGVPDLPQNAPSFESEYFEDSGETVFRYGGRSYSYFGRLNGSMSKNSFNECLGYVDDDMDTRMYSLTEDPLNNYLMIRHTGGIMDQPEFLRADDTKNKDIFTPSYIKSGSYESWSSSGIHYGMQSVSIGLVCNTENIRSITYEADINGTSAFSGGVEYANKSTIRKGDLFTLDFNELELADKAVAGEVFNISLRFNVTDAEGTVHEVDGTYSRDMMFGASLNGLEIRADGNGRYYLLEDI